MINASVSSVAVRGTRQIEQGLIAQNYNNEISRVSITNSRESNIDTALYAINIATGLQVAQNTVTRYSRNRLASLQPMQASHQAILPPFHPLSISFLLSLSEVIS